MDTFNQVFFKVQGHEITGKMLAISVASLVSLIVLKRFFSGGKCNIKRDLTGKYAVITGGNTGIGYETTLHLARMNCNILIGARDKPRLEATLKDVKKINPKIQVSYYQLDLGDKQSIKEFSEYVSQNCSQIDYLVNNAGVMMVPERRETKDGLEMQIGINHFGHFYLTYLLFPLLKKAPEFRITNVSSLAHLRSKGINFDDVQSKNSYDASIVYGQSKLANIYFTKALQERLDKAGIKGKSVCLHPGVVRTELTRYMKTPLQILLKLFYPIFWFVGKNPWQGAQTNLYTVLEEYEKLVPGAYYSDCKVTQSSNISKNKELAEKLWKVSEDTWNVKFDI